MIYLVYALKVYTRKRCFWRFHDIPSHDVPQICAFSIYQEYVCFTYSWHTHSWYTLFTHFKDIPEKADFHGFMTYHRTMYPVFALFVHTGEVCVSHIHGIHVRMYHVSAYTLFHLRLFLQLTHIPATCVFRGFMTYRPRMYPISVLYEYTYNWLLPHIHGIVTSDIPCFCMLTIYSKTVFLAVSWHTVSRCTPNLRILNIPIIRVFHIFMTYSLMIYLVYALEGYNRKRCLPRVHDIPSNDVPHIYIFCTYGWCVRLTWYGVPRRDVPCFGIHIVPPRRTMFLITLSADTNS